MKLYPNVTRIFIIWLVVVSLVSYLGFYTLLHSGKFNYDFLGSLANWDGGHFLGIAEKGYSEKFQYAFFPLYPLAIKLVSQITQNYLLAAVLISLASAFFGLQLLYRLVAEDFEKKIAQNSVLALMFFPTSFFFLTVYSEGLFFFLTIVAFYLLKKNNLFWAVVAAALVSATRLVGLAVAAGIIIDVLTRQGLNRKNWYVLLAPLGFIAYSVFLYQQTGDPFYFLVAENHWQRTLAIPGVGFWETLKDIINNGLTGPDFSIVVDLFFAVFGLGFAVRAFRFLPPSYAVYSLLSVAIPLFTPTLSSMPRFLLPVFPIFILMAMLKNQFIYLFLQIISIMLLAVFSIFFITGYWVS